MHTLIVCGTPWCNLNSVYDQLQLSGLALPQPSSSGSIRTITDWHQRLFAHQPQLAEAIQPGKSWEQAAGAIFLANWEQPVWGWADARSTWLLDFWLNFDPQTCFVLVHTPAVDALVAAAYHAGHANFDAQQVLDLWCAHQAHMLQFSLRQRDRCAWVSMPRPSQSSDAISQAIRLPWSLPLERQLQIASPSPRVDPSFHLLCELAHTVVQGHELAALLQQEVWAVLPSAHKPAQTPLALQSTVPLSQRAVGLFNQVRELAVVQTTTLSHQIDEAARQAQAHADETVQLQAKINAEVMARKEASEEAELLLVQLHQVQEDLENSFLLHKQVESERDALQAYADETDQLKAKINAEVKAREEANEEAELLLMQLLQVQEELEHYFLLHQQVEAERDALNGRLARWTQRDPNVCVWSQITVKATSKGQALDVHLIDLEYGDRLLPEIHFTLINSPQGLVLKLPLLPNNEVPLLKWPTDQTSTAPSARLQEWRLNPLAKPGSSDAALLAKLAPSDAKLLSVVCHALAQHLTAQAPSGPNAGLDWPLLCQTTASALCALPPAWRYDAIELREEQRIEGYEHLWLKLSRVHFGQRAWPTFEFVLSAHNVQSNGWSHLPKLEFPPVADGQPQAFENWYAVSEDHKGPKFELRFDSQSTAMDIGCWSALSVYDQAQALALVHCLPSMLKDLEAANTHIGRLWTDWHTLANGIQHALFTSLGIQMRSAEV